MAQIKTLADVRAVESIPLLERDLAPHTYELFERISNTYGNATALTFFLQGTEYASHVQYSFNDLHKKITRTANLFHSLGVGKDDVVSYLLPNLPQTYFTLYGAEAAGIANPLNPLLEPHVLAEIMNAAGTKVLVTLTPFPKTDIWEKVVQIANDVPTLETILQVDIADYLSGFKKIMVNLLRIGKNNNNLHAKVLNFDTELSKHPDDRLISERDIQPGDTASYFHTGGTTGTPKLAIHTHFNEVYDAWAAVEMIDGKSGDTTFLGLPLFHNYGAIAIGIGSWTHGINIIMGTPSGYRGEGVVENFWKILDHYDCTVFAAVPTLYKSLLNIPLNDADLSKVKLTTSGAAPLPLELAKQFSEKTGIKILEGYGLTEGTSVSSVNPQYGEARSGSIGFPLPYQEIKIAELEDGVFQRFCELEETGTVIIRGPNVFPGYKDDFFNKDVFVDSGDGKGHWLNTGDLGRVDADGYLYLTGRKKEVIIRGGHNIDPKLIEEALHEHPAVALAAAVGRPDARVGELPVAYAELKPDENATEDELLGFLKDKIGERAALPKQLYIVESIPLTAVGKIFKPSLIREQIKEVYQLELGQLEGVEAVLVEAEGDKRLGTKCQVNVTLAASADRAQVEQACRQVLGQFSIAYDLTLD